MGDNRQQAKYAAARAAVIEEVEFLLGMRVDAEQIAQRLSTKRKSLVRRLQRSGRRDLASMINRKVA